MLRVSAALRVQSNLLPELIKRSPAAASRVVRATAFHLQASARQFAPVDTGALRNSIDNDARPGLTSAWVYTDLEYAPAQEYGFIHWLGGNFVSGQPFLRPAALIERSLFHSRMRRELANLI